MGFHARVDIGEGADRAGNLAGRDLLARGDEALAVAGELGVMAGELQAEGRRLGMNPMTRSPPFAAGCSAGSCRNFLGRDFFGLDG
jgi:hypothetical protein